MTETSRQSIFDSLEGISDPHTGTSLGKGKSVGEVTFDGSLVEAKLTPGIPGTRMACRTRCHRSQDDHAGRRWTVRD